MKIIDAHIHTSFQRSDWQEIAKRSKVDFSLEGLRAEIKQSGISRVISLADTFSDATPIGHKWILPQLAECTDMIGVCGINPLKLDSRAIKLTRDLLLAKKIRGLKVYSGYYPKHPTDKSYHKIYSLAQELGVPVIFHTGDTLFKTALLKYAHPLAIDEVAVKYPQLKIIIAHCGNPWFVDAAAVAYKNENVFLDLSGLAYETISPTRDITSLLEFVQDYAGCDKLVYGSDWPLIRLKSYLEFMKKAIPKKYYTTVFYKNAARLFGLC